MPALAMKAFVTGFHAGPIQADTTLGYHLRTLLAYVLVVAVSYTLIAAAGAHKVGVDSRVASAVVAPLSS